MLAERGSVLVIGAGIAGATVARQLHEAGHEVVLVDKARSVGGRMATRRTEGELAFDHGAQYFTARDPAFVLECERWAATGAVGPWAESGWLVGAPSMSAPVRALVSGLAVVMECTVGRVTRAGARWRVSDAAGAPLLGGRAFDSLLLTCPAPQTHALLATAGVELAGVGRARYSPCWALMLAHAGPPAMDIAYRLDADPSAPIGWIARDATKPGRRNAGETLVMHASAGWSARHLEDAAESVAAALRVELRRLLGPSAPADADITFAAAHRWRYARVEEPVGEACLWSPELRIGAAGDWCLGPRVEAAYVSGAALAERVIAAHG